MRISMRRESGFVLVELASVVVVAALLAGLLLVSAGDMRRRGMLASSEANLHRLASATTAYTADNAELYWSFSWSAGDSYSEWPDLNGAPNDVQARANQAVDIIRRRVDPNFGRLNGWLPDIFYSQLVLADAMDAPLPARWMASPADEQLQGWQDDRASAPSPRLPFSSSYEVPVAFFDKGEPPQRISSGGTHNFYLIPPKVVLGARKTADVRYPSQKAHVYDRYQRHFGERIAFFAYREARLPILFSDGSASVRKTGDGNPGWQPNQPESPAPTSYAYQPAAWEPPVLDGKDTVTGYLRWTREGIAGRDFGGPEPGLP